MIKVVTREDFCDLLGEGIHTGLRKGTDAPDAHALWKAIADSETGAWQDAIEYAVEGLIETGFTLVSEGVTE